MRSLLVSEGVVMFVDSPLCEMQASLPSPGKRDTGPQLTAAGLGRQQARANSGECSNYSLEHARTQSGLLLHRCTATEACAAQQASPDNFDVI